MDSNEQHLIKEPIDGVMKQRSYRYWPFNLYQLIQGRKIRKGEYVSYIIAVNNEKKHTEDIYTCMYVCMYVRTYVCMYVCR